MKKLYEVRTELIAYVAAEDEKEARRLGADVLNEDALNIDLGNIDVEQVTTRHWPIEGGWEPDGMLPGERNLTLGDMLKTLPEDPQWKRLMELHHSLEPGRNPLPAPEVKSGDPYQDDQGKWKVKP
jgi:hypothetical protein